MNIQQAAQAAKEKNAAMRRRAWPEGFSNVILPFGTTVSCLVERSSNLYAAHWMPMAEDLIADDWGIAEGDLFYELCGEIDHS